MSEADNQQSGADLSLGKQLRINREQKGLTIDDVAHHLKIDPVLLQDFENEREPSHSLPEVYCKGFLRNYARYLGVDIQPGQIKACRTSEPLQKGDSTKRYTEKRSLLPYIVVAVAILLLILSGGSLNGLQSLFTAEQKAEQPVVTESPKETVEERDPQTTRIEPTTDKAPATEAPETESVTVAPTDAEENSAVTETTDTTVEATEVQTSTVADAVNEQSAAEKASVEEPTETTPAATRGTVTIRYIDSSWTQVTDGLGRVLVKRTLDAGAIEDYEGPLPLQINLGNAIGVRVQFNGQPFDHLNFIDDNNIAQFTLGGAGS